MFSLNDELNDLNVKTRNITSATVSPEETTMAGALVVPIVKNDTGLQMVSANGDIQMIANDINLDAVNVLVNGNPIGTSAEVADKVQNLEATAGNTTLYGDLQIASGLTLVYDSSFVLVAGQKNANTNTMAYSTDDGGMDLHSRRVRFFCRQGCVR
jgi:hypothetical protein